MRKSNLFLAILSGLLLAASMPRPGLWPLAWVGLAPMLAAIRGLRTRDAVAIGAVTGFVYFAVILFWVSLFGYLPWVAIAVIEAIIFGVFAAAASRLMPEKIGRWSYIAVPAAWTAVQWLRSLGLFGFTWGSFAHIEANNTYILQLASIGGPWLIEFVVCLVNLLLAQAITKKRAGAAVAAGIVLVSAHAIGYAILQTSSELQPDTKVAIIQGNVPQDVVPDISYLADTYIKYSRMSRKVAEDGAKLIVWPETTLPTTIRDSNWGGILSDLAKETKTTYVIGGYSPSPDFSNPLTYNSAIFWNSNGIRIGEYHKVHLVPYGEFVPLRDYMPFLARYGIRDQDVLAGKTHNTVKTDIGVVGTNICFESLFPQISRIETAKGAEVLLVITNDAWFERSQAARGHLMMSQLRAVENRRYIVRGAATGISAIIDPRGKIVTELGIFKKGIVSGRIEKIKKLSIYTRIGDSFAYTCAILALAFLAKRRKKN